eukprot:jgi/Botrbrau1/1195/Bobra.0163s0009.1
MMHFFHQFLLYTTFEVLEPLWHTLQAHIRASTTVDQIIAHHKEFLRRVMKGCLLSRKVKLLRNLIDLKAVGSPVRSHLLPPGRRLRSLPLHLPLPSSGVGEGGAGGAGGGGDCAAGGGPLQRAAGGGHHRAGGFLLFQTPHLHFRVGGSAPRGADGQVGVAGGAGRAAEPDLAPGLQRLLQGGARLPGPVGPPPPPLMPHVISTWAHVTRCPCGLVGSPGPRPRRCSHGVETLDSRVL